MDLVPVMSGPAAAMEENTGPNEFTVPTERQQQIGVTYATVERRSLRRTLRAAGIVQPDASRIWRFVARTDGYVEKLLVLSSGEMVEKGTPLMTIYSPDLLTAERELLQLSNNRDSSSSGQTAGKLVEAAKNRLRQWNVTEAQIAGLLKSGVPSDNLTLLSPFRGLVQMVAVQQGANVKQGDTLMEIIDLSEAWVWAEFYESEFSLLKPGQKVRVKAKAWPGETFDGQIAVLDPALDENTRTVKARIDIPNAGFKLRPGMYATIDLDVDMGVGLAVPISAIIPTGVHNIAFVDQGGGKLQPRFVQLGREFDGCYEVLSGLSEGERVVSSANFLIDAESKVQGALKDFSEQSPEGRQ
jgi:Cu(I)/Ag(I) efflux system membrane fusion protein